MVGIRNYYAGREFDSFTELSYNRARWYDPSAGRFISEDPIGFAGGDANLYRYAGNSPDNATDPSGNLVVTTAVLTGVAIYVGWQALFAAGETGIEAAATNAFGSDEDVDNFSYVATFGKNFGINLLTGGIGGKAKTASTLARLTGQAALYAGRQGIEVAGDTALDVGLYGRDLNSALLYNTVGSIAGEGLGRALRAGGRAFHRDFEVSFDSSNVYVGSVFGGAGSLRINVSVPRATGSAASPVTGSHRLSVVRGSFGEVWGGECYMESCADVWRRQDARSAGNIGW